MAIVRMVPIPPVIPPVTQFRGHFVDFRVSAPKPVVPDLDPLWITLSAGPYRSVWPHKAMELGDQGPILIDGMHDALRTLRLEGWPRAFCLLEHDPTGGVQMWFNILVKPLP